MLNTTGYAEAPPPRSSAHCDQLHIWDISQQSQYDIICKMCRFFSVVLLAFRRPIILFYCLEALLGLIWFRFLIVWLPFWFWGPRCGIAYAETLQTDMTPVLSKIRLISRCVIGVSSSVPWTSLCLDRALTCAFMLKRRGVSSTVLIGLSKHTDTHWNAHAWLRCGNHFLMGHSPDQPFKLVKTIACVA